MIFGMPVEQLLALSRAAKKQSGKSVISQIIDIIRLRASKGRITAEYYYNYRLFDPEFTWIQKTKYVGPWAKSRIYRMQDSETAKIFSDKALSYRFFHEKGWPHPKVLAITNAANPVAGAITLNDERELEAWLGNKENYPFFCKPAVSYLGYGAKLIDRPENGNLVLGNGETISIADFVSQHSAPNGPVMLFQELIRPHPALRKVIGNRVATARIVVLNKSQEPRILAAGLRIPSGKSMTDNFQSGKSGNMIAFVDLESGRLRKVLSGLGVNWHEVSVHPDTAEPIVDFHIPDWKVAIDLVLTASRAIPGLKMHGWDVAFSDRGPLLVETNPRGDLNIAQLAPGRGLLADADFLALYPNDKF